MSHPIPTFMHWWVLLTVNTCCCIVVIRNIIHVYVRGSSFRVFGTYWLYTYLMEQLRMVTVSASRSYEHKRKDSSKTAEIIFWIQIVVTVSSKFDALLLNHGMTTFWKYVDYFSLQKSAKYLFFTFSRDEFLHFNLW